MKKLLLLLIIIATLAWYTPDRIDLTDDGSNSIGYTWLHECFVPPPTGIDDTEMLQTTIDRCANGIINLQSGTYNTSAPIHLHSDINLIGHDSVILPKDGVPYAIQVDSK